jgi:hypothetical protein
MQIRGSLLRYSVYVSRETLRGLLFTWMEGPFYQKFVLRRLDVVLDHGFYATLAGSL